MKLKRTIGGGRNGYSVSAKQTKKVGLFTLIMLFICTVILGCAFIAPKNVKAAAPTASDTVIQLTLDSTNLAPTAQSGKMFSGEGLAKLYDAILGTDYNNVGTYNKLKKALTNADGTTIKTWTSNTSTATTVVPNAITAADIRANHGSNVQVMIGKTAFEVVYVTLDNSGDIVVDLWQATSTQLSPWAADASGTVGYSSNDRRNNNANTRPSNVYGNSYIRAKMLGQGGTWDAFSGQACASTPQSAATVGASISSDYGALWDSMTKSTGSLYSFIDTPSQVKYQEVESYSAFRRSTANGTQSTNNYEVTGRRWWAYTLPGDAYGTPYDEWYHDGSAHYWNSGVNTGYGGSGTNPITNQDQWKTDKLWLPSAAEIGNNGVMDSSDVYVNGIWDIDDYQRKNDNTAYPGWSWNTSSTNCSWLRSGMASYSNIAFALTSSGALQNYQTSCSFAVRPALHLNLTAASKSAASGAGSNAAEYTAVNTPTDIEFTYDGIEYTDMVSIIKRVEAGKQKSPADANGDTNGKKEVKWFDEVLHAVGGNTAGTGLANSLYSTGAAIEYKVEYKPIGKSSYASPMTDFKIKGAGEYKITCSLETGSGTVYKWRDINTGALDTDASKTFTITVKQLEVKYKWKSQGGKLNETDTDPAKQWKVTFDKDTFTPTSGNSAAPWVYLEYTLLTTTNTTDNASAAILTYDQTNKKAMLGANVNETLPCVVVKYVNIEQYDNPIDNIYVNKNGTTRPVNGTSHAYPEQAGHYTVTAVDINAATSNYKLVPDAGEPSLTSTRAYEIEKQEVQVPTKPAIIFEYSGSEQKYRVPNYDEDYMEYGTWDGTTFTKDATPTDMTAGTTGSDAPLTLKATKVNDYKVSFRLLETTVENTTAHPDPLVRNYKWKSTDTTINGTADVVTINYAIEPKTLEFDFHSSVTNNGSETFTIKANDTTGKLTYSFKNNCGPVTPTGATEPEEPVLELYFAMSGSTGAGSINPDNATTPDEFIYKNLLDSNGKHTAGKYVIYVTLASSSANPVNKNYRIKDPDAIAAEMTAKGDSQSNIDAAVKAAKATFEKEITLNAGETSLNDLPIVYKEGNDITNSDPPIALSFDYANKQNLQYKLGADGKTPVQYWIYFDLSDDFSFLETVGAIGYQYDAPATDTSLCTYDPYNASGNPMKYAGTLTITVKIQVKASERANNKLPAQADYDNLNTVTSPNKFVYTAGTPDISDGNVYDGTLVFTYQIRKAEIDNTKISDTSVLQWKYSTDDDTKWRDYSDKNLPEYNEIAQVDFRVNPTKYNTNGDGTLSGVTAASLNSITNAAGQPEKQGPGQRFVTIAYTVDENNFEKVNYNNTTLVGKYKYTVEISPKVIDSSKLTLTTWKDTDGTTDKTNSLGVPYQIWELQLDDPTFKNFIEYEYYLYDGGTDTVGALIGTGEQALLDLTNPNGVYGNLNIDAGSAAYIYVKPVINLAKVDKVNGEPKYTLKDVSGNTDKDANGDEGYKKFEFGKQMTVIKVELVNDSSVYKDSFAAADIIKITIGGSTAAESTYNTKVYKDKVDDANLVGDLGSFCANSASLDAGKYVIKVTAVNGDLFVAVPATVEFNVTPKELQLPTLGEMVFTGEYQSAENYLGGSWEQIKSLVTLGGDYKDIRNVSASGYTFTLELTDSNYCWEYPAAASPTVKVLTKYSATDVEITPVNATTAAMKWNIAPMVVDASNLWSKGNKGATLRLPDAVNMLITGETLSVGYRYYDDAGQYIESPELKGGKSFRVEAVFGGIDAEHGNVVFKTSDGNFGTTSDKISYTVPQSGAAAFFGNALSFVKSHWLWFVIALAALIFLIILICIIKHRRKTKEAREEKKAKKQEEKERKEEEKRRREQELELEKAKREAELAKMKAELGLGAGAAGMAMAAQAQPVQQQMPQQMPMQQPMMQPQMMPQYQQPQYPQYPQQMPMPQQSSADAGVLARLEAQLNAMQAEQRAKYEAEQRMELAAMHAEQRMDREAYQRAELAAMREQLNGRQYMQSNMPANGGNMSPNAAMDMLGALVVSALKSISTGKPMEEVQPKLELTQSTDDTAIATPTVYPPDAVITTTTTVDTTKTKPAEPVSRDSERNFDIDGFYDTFDVNNK